MCNRTRYYKPNFKKLRTVFFILIVIFSAGFSFGQKNAVTFMLVPPTFSFGSVSIGYAYQITEHVSINTVVSGNYVPYNAVLSFSAFRYYFATDSNKSCNNLYVSLFFQYSKAEEIYDAEPPPNTYLANLYGLGLAVGRRNFISKNKRVFLDLGIGASYSYLTDFVNTENGKPGRQIRNFLWFPRLIFNFGFRF